MAQFMSHGQRDQTRGQDLPVVLNGYEPRVEGGHGAVMEGGVL